MPDPLKILLVEDNPDTVEFLGRRLRDEGFEVFVARNGLEAWRIANAERPSAIVMDINLPQMNGDDVVRKLRAQPETAKIPVVFMTAESELRVRDLLQDDLTICLEKAIKSKTLVDALNRLVPRVPEPVEGT